jgi:DNA-binding CsgD family transcriptional regulator
VGRHAELGQLRAELTRALAGQHRLVVVEGDGGIGKTSLIGQLADSLPNGVVIGASGEESESDLAWGVVSQLVADLGRHDRRSNPRARPPAPGADPLAVGAGLVVRIERLAAEVPVVVIVLDDLHWCDPMSATALLFALRRLDAQPVLSVAAVRPPFPGGLGEGWRRLVTARGRSLALGGLGDGELVELAARLGRPVSLQAAKRIRHHTGGHPLWATALLFELASGELEGSEGALPVPRDLAGAIRARHAALSRPARALVAAGAVLGERFSAPAGSALAGLDDPAPALQEAIDAGLLAEVSAPTGTSTAFGFTHPLVRAAIYQDLGPVRRSRLHGEAARLTSGPEALSHLVAAALAPSEAVAAELEAAGNAEADGDDLALAQLHLDASVRLSPPGQGRERRLLAAMETHLRAREPGKAKVYAPGLEQGEPQPRRDYMLGYLARSEGRLADAEALLLRAWDLLRAPEEATGRGAGSTVGEGLGKLPGASTGSWQAHGGENELAGKIAVELAAIAHARWSAPDLLYWANAVLARCEKASLLHLARYFKAVGLALDGACAEAVALVGTGPPQAVELHQLVARGMARLWSDDLAGAYDDLALAASRAKAGEVLHVGQPLALLAETCYRLGRLQEATAHIELACAIADASGWRWDFPAAHARAGCVAAAAGDLLVAEAHAGVITEAVSHIAAEPGGRERLRGWVVAAAEVNVAVALARGDPRALLVAVAPVAKITSSVELGTSPFGPVLAEALVGVGRLEDAAAVLDVYDKRAAELGRRSAQMSSARVRGSLCAARGDLKGARLAFDAALELGRSLQLPLELGRLQLAYADALATMGDRLAAAAHLRAARVIFARTGALAYLQQADAALACLGPDGDAGSAVVLTAAEHTVAGLAGNRLTNREIADQLAVSTKTVEYHLSHIYAKLGVHSRNELARMIGATLDAPNGP